jgi:hypothetical protein
MKISFIKWPQAVINKALLALSLAYLGGCTTTQTDLIQASKLVETPHAEQQRSNCMSEQQVFTSRNSMVSTAAIESAWVYCKRYSDFWYPGRDEADYTSGWDTQVEEQKDFAPRLSRPE